MNNIIIDNDMLILILVILGVMVTISLLLTALIFKRAGAPVWAIFVPVYNMYILMKIVGIPFLVFIVYAIFQAIPLAGLKNIQSFATFLFVYSFAVKLAASFGHEIKTGIIAAIFFPLSVPFIVLRGTYLGNYVGETRNEEKIYEGDELKVFGPPPAPAMSEAPKLSSAVNLATTESENTETFCPQCGNKVTKDFRICMRCGYQRPL